MNTKQKQRAIKAHADANQQWKRVYEKTQTEGISPINRKLLAIAMHRLNEEDKNLQKHGIAHPKTTAPHADYS